MRGHSGGADEERKRQPEEVGMRGVQTRREDPLEPLFQGINKSIE